MANTINEAVFVFGSNRAGRHGAGAARFAREHKGAIYSQGEGIQGRSYGISTKDEALKTLPRAAIAAHVQTFLAFANVHPNYRFEITPIGCGLAGYSPADIAPVFVDTPANCELPREFLYVLGRRPT